MSSLYSNTIPMRHAARDEQCFLLVQFETADFSILSILSTDDVDDPTNNKDWYTGRRVSFRSNGQQRTALIFMTSPDRSFLQTQMEHMAYTSQRNGAKPMYIMLANTDHKPSAMHSPVVTSTIEEPPAEPANTRYQASVLENTKLESLPVADDHAIGRECNPPSISGPPVLPNMGYRSNGVNILSNSNRQSPAANEYTFGCQRNLQSAKQPAPLVLMTHINQSDEGQIVEDEYTFQPEPRQAESSVARRPLESSTATTQNTSTNVPPQKSAEKHRILNGKSVMLGTKVSPRSIRGNKDCRPPTKSSATHRILNGTSTLSRGRGTATRIVRDSKKGPKHSSHRKMLDRLSVENKVIMAEQYKMQEQLRATMASQSKLVRLVHELLRRFPGPGEDNDSDPTSPDLTVELLDMSEIDVPHNVTIDYSADISDDATLNTTNDDETKADTFPLPAMTPTGQPDKPIVKRRVAGTPDSLTKKSRKSSSKENESPHSTAIMTHDQMVVIGENGTRVKQSVLDTLKWTSHTEVTRKLLLELFGKDVLASHSLTGRPSPAFMNRPCKQKLDQNIVNDLISFVVSKCKVPVTSVRNSITTKCADENKMLRQRNEREGAAHDATSDRASK